MIIPVVHSLHSHYHESSMHNIFSLSYQYASHFLPATSTSLAPRPSLVWSINTMSANIMYRDVSPWILQMSSSDTKGCILMHPYTHNKLSSIITSTPNASHTLRTMPYSSSATLSTVHPLGLHHGIYYGVPRSMFYPQLF